MNAQLTCGLIELGRLLVPGQQRCVPARITTIPQRARLMQAAQQAPTTAMAQWQAQAQAERNQTLVAGQTIAVNKYTVQVERYLSQGTPPSTRVTTMTIS